ncbi:MAG TPA: YceH family protein [Terriglobales bacterium]
MDIVLNGIEARVLGALIEKDITTPDYYPLSLNALVNACNQKNNRDPVMSLDEGSVREALTGLQQKRLAGSAGGADSRVTKYEHRVQEVFNFTRAETALFCVLLLRGPQTPGELRGRTERMYRFGELSEVQAALEHLIERDPPLVKMLPRQPGTKESRYAHLLAGEVAGFESPIESTRSLHGSPADDGRVAKLENDVRELRQEIAALKQQMDRFSKQGE